MYWALHLRTVTQVRSFVFEGRFWELAEYFDEDDKVPQLMSC